MFVAGVLATSQLFCKGRGAAGYQHSLPRPVAGGSAPQAGQQRKWETHVAEGRAVTLAEVRTVLSRSACDEEGQRGGPHHGGPRLRRCAEHARKNTGDAFLYIVQNTAAFM
jgi:hypothetical protein